jgi:CheY-like chemotaxis protein
LRGGRGKGPRSLHTGRSGHRKGRCTVLVRQLQNRKNGAWYGVSERDRYAPKKVLVVEDSADDVELLQIAARTAPDAVSFHIVPDGEKALAYLKGEGHFADRQAHPFPDLILLDLWLPGMSGFDVLAWIRAHPEFNALQVFVWTDSGDRETLDRAVQAGANRFVPKSVSFVRGGLAGLVRSISEAIVIPANKDRL